MKGLASIEFTSTKYDNVGFDSDLFLQVRGFKTGRAWIGYSFAFMIPFTLIFSFILGVVLKYVRIEPGKAHVKRQSVAIGQIVEKTEDEFNLPFTPVGLTFENLVYEVKASTGNEILRILNEVSGAFMAGRMCALMGSSGAGACEYIRPLAHILCHYYIDCLITFPCPAKEKRRLWMSLQ